MQVIQEQQENVNRKLYQTISGIADTEPIRKILLH